MSLASASDVLPLPPRRRTQSKQHAHGLPSNKEVTLAWGLVILLVALWGTSIVMFGLPGLFLPAVGAVPVIVAILLLITWG